MSGGTKHDQDKPRTDLLDYTLIEGIARVLGFGAKKYTKYGECNCKPQQTRNASTTGATASDIGSNSALKSGFAPFTSERPSQSINAGIASETRNGLLRTNELGQSLQNSVPASGYAVLPPDMVSHLQRQDGLRLEARAQSADRQSESVLTMTTSAGECEDFYATPATSGLASSSAAKTGLSEHAPTCPALRAVSVGEHNWRKGINVSRLLGATLRHVFAFQQGQDNDPESGLSHLYHAGCCLMFAAWMHKHRKDLDDRWRAVNAEPLPEPMPIRDERSVSRLFEEIERDAAKRRGSSQEWDGTWAPQKQFFYGPFNSGPMEERSDHPMKAEELRR